MPKRLGVRARRATTLPLIALTVLLSGSGAGAISVPTISSQVTIDPSAAGSLSLADVSCVSAGNCTAVGSLVQSASQVAAVVVTESSGTWGAPVVVPLPAGAVASGRLNGLTAVRCVSAGNCTAVGRFANSASDTTTPMALSEVGGVWSSPTVLGQPANGSGGISAWLTGLSCPSVGNCTAVGTYFTTQNQVEPMALSEVAGTWGTPSQIDVASGNLPVQGEWSVSCSAAACEAAGPLSSGTNSFAGVASDVGGTWGVAAPVSSLSGTAITDIDCQSAGCVAVGSLDTASTLESAIFTETSGNWTMKTVTAAPATGDAALEALSCVSWGNCVAAGDVTTGTGAFALAEEKGTWTPSLRIPVSNDASAAVVGITGLSCTSALACVAVGGVGASNDVTAVAWTSVAPRPHRTIVCRKGRLVRRVSGAAPHCPAGYRRV